MSFIAKIAGRVRGLTVPQEAESRENAEFVMNNRGDQCVVQSLPELAELVRLGNSFQIQTSAGQAALTALPSTLSGLSIVNVEPASGRCLVIESFGSWEAVVDATQTDVTALFAMLNSRASAAASAGTTEALIRSLSGRAALDVAITARRGATVVNDGWFPHSTEGAQMAAAAAGANWKVNEARVRGLYLVPPGGSFSIQTVKAAAAAAAQQFFFIRAHAVQLIYVP